jgi:hypothetical protein
VVERNPRGAIDIFLRQNTQRKDSHMKNLLRRADHGMTTAEYTVGTLGACTIGGVLVKIGHT